ncbi:hypothetical protein [Vibrio nomapromontoriensis]|uniref:hypothetical protein n=1 Tax=Vibrio nomapromontoriensis TaxID=2910246 RepID=UPI003D1288FF
MTTTAGLAAMSDVSRTGRLPTTSGVDVLSAQAISLGEHTVRTMANLSGTGVVLPDWKRYRVTIHD